MIPLRRTKSRGLFKAQRAPTTGQSPPARGKKNAARGGRGRRELSTAHLGDDGRCARAARGRLARRARVARRRASGRRSAGPKTSVLRARVDDFDAASAEGDDERYPNGLAAAVRASRRSVWPSERCWKERDSSIGLAHRFLDERSNPTIGLNNNCFKRQTFGLPASPPNYSNS